MKAKALWHSWQHDNWSISADIAYEVTSCFINHLVSELKHQTKKSHGDFELSKI